MTAPAVEALGLSRSFGARRALDDVSFAVPKGETFALLGPNGGGKTTLFRILSTSLPPSAGSFRLAGLEPARHLAAARRSLGVVFQAPSLDKKLTVAENLRVQGALFGLSRAETAARAEALLARFGVAERARDRVETLSGGLARRVEIAKALLHRPETLLLDEPSAGLDPLARRDLRALLAGLAADGTTVLLTTHLFEEAEAADRIGILDRGRLVAIGSPAALKADVGGDVLVLEPSAEDDAEALARDLGGLFPELASATRRVGTSLRIERPRGHEPIPALVEALGPRLKSVTLGKPSLEDVFVARAGHRFSDAPEAPAEASAA